MDRLLGSQGSVDTHKLRMGKLDAEEGGRLVEAGGRLSVEHGADRFTVRAELPVGGR